MRSRAFVFAGLFIFGVLLTLLLFGMINTAHANSLHEPVAPPNDADLDSTFGNAGVVTMAVPGTFVRVAALPNGQVLALLVQPDDPDYEYSKTTGKLVRFNENGSLDTTFGINGIVEPRSVDQTVCLQNNAGFADFAVQSNGKILAWYECGMFTRLLPNGATDTGFGQQGMMKAEGGLEWLATAPDGKLYLGRRGSPYGGWSMTRYFNNGALDAGFGMTGTIRSESPFFANAFSHGASLDGIVTLQDGGVILGHSAFTAWPTGSTSNCYIDIYPANGQNRNRLFIPPNMCFYGIRDGDGHMLAYGPCLTCTTRLNADGSVDSSFGLSGTISSTLGLNPQPRQSNGKYFCLPTSTTFDLRACGGNWPEANDRDILLARLDPLGVRDASFGENGVARFVFTYTIKSTIPPTIINSSRANDVTLEFNGRIVIAGSYLNNVAPCNQPPFCNETIRRFPVLLRLKGAPVHIEKYFLPLIAQTTTRAP